MIVLWEIFENLNWNEARLLDYSSFSLKTNARRILNLDI